MFEKKGKSVIKFRFLILINSLIKTLLIILFTISISCLSEKSDEELLNKLDYALENKDRYIAIKEEKIEKLKQILEIETFLPRQEYSINQKIYGEYYKYCSDSAIVYINKNRTIALNLNDIDMINETALCLVELYSTTGLYIEAAELIEEIDRSSLSGRFLQNYFKICSEFYSHYGQSNDKWEWYKQSGIYRDSLLLTLDIRSFQYRVEAAAKHTFTIFDLVPENDLLQLFEEAGSTRYKGLIAWLLGLMYEQTGNIELCKKYYAISVINDIEHCIRDNASMQSLALIYFKHGDIASAYRFINYAVEDALFCNVRYRISEASGYYPIINDRYQAQEKKQKTRLLVLLAGITILFFTAMISMMFVYRQNRRLNNLKMELSKTNEKLCELNKKLTTTNNSLLESNTVKEEYITHFFDLCSSYVDKLEYYRRILNKNARQGKIDEMLKVLDYGLIERELEELFKKFDTIFLNLFPTFVEDFNAKRADTDKIVLKHGELLNTELRIFALIRLGISDSVKIASFLRYSVSAIYNYRVKARKLCNTDKKTFEELVMKMGLVSSGK